MLRPVACASVHAARRGQGWQMDVAKSTCTTDSPLASLAGCHPTLNWETSSAPGVCARRVRLPTGIDVNWPHQVTPMRLASVQDAFGAAVARVHQLVRRQQIRPRQLVRAGPSWSWIVSSAWGSCSSAGAGCTSVMRCGHSSSPPGVTGTLSPTHSRLRLPPYAPVCACIRPACGRSAHRGRRANAATRPPVGVPAA